MFYPKTIKSGGKKYIAGSRKTISTLNEKPDLDGLDDFMTMIASNGFHLSQMSGNTPTRIGDADLEKTLTLSLFLNKTGNYKDKTIHDKSGPSVVTYYVFEMTDASGANQYTIMHDDGKGALTSVKSVPRFQLLSDENVATFDNYAGHNKKLAAGKNNEPLSTFAGDPNKKRRREFNDRMDGMPPEQKGNKFYPKPYRLYDSEDVYGDKIRIFAKCVSGGRPHEMIDVMLMTQSL